MTFHLCAMLKRNQSFKKSKLPVKTTLITLSLWFKFYCVSVHSNSLKRPEELLLLHFYAIKKIVFHNFKNKLQTSIHLLCKKIHFIQFPIYSIFWIFY